ncbi:TetR/AcrR family transcriptional regulator [Actinacidiphila bryophytorum]|uniref:TetR family transcriptional regulator n=1 Tax=Actinacidiphila bryophytorum TaxID=1436133 RepID=A0A9W4H8D3_9ACTN|nr:TetR/AcrR family transcriptional regulator [Actinacidiphila bryophytorum]MBM9438237.1 WHG domain-containing protein [Actinacidiphila bryophytorum]MBN6542977.1 WHG domain-containing protein [Actinacidiphila bryophytorum]CAG7657719.1 TetR family transcriptional regulator [Actinacidiphila bryophytorum]
MPSPEKTSRGAIVAAGRDILEAGGREGLTMQSVATRVGVRAPSLYKHVRNRAALLAAVSEAAVAELAARLEGTDGSLEELVRAYRGFARDRPEGFRLMLSQAAPPEALGRAADPVLRACAQLAGEQDALDAARLVTAWATGFIGMELAGGFRLGGDVDRSFEYGLARMRRALGPA